jgi:purine-nucleoside phosphorylase
MMGLPPPLPLYDRVTAAAAEVRARLGDRVPRIGLILGSGLGGWADRLEDAVAIEYGSLPHFPPSAVAGHAGRLVVGRAPGGGPSCIAMQGRVHLYEGHTAELVAFPARVLVTLGARVLVVTNAAGGLRPEWDPGTLMLIRDHIDLLRDHPLRGLNDERFGPRFPDMTRAYAPELRALVHEVAAARGLPLAEGVYVAMPGPNY